MEKRTAHYSLEAIKTLVKGRGIECFTFVAQRGIRMMNLSDGEALSVINGLTRRQFYKSMTTHEDHRIWQDVYHAETLCGSAYVKFTLREDGAIVISFKAL